MPTLSVNGLRASSIRLWHPWQGAWIAECDVDLDTPVNVPAGPSTILIGTQTLIGTIDSDGSGRNGLKAKLRVIAGGGGWHRTVSARSYHNDARVLSTAVITTTAAEAGERAVDVTPTPLGVHYDRVAGPASSVLAGRDWHVDLSGTTIVGPRVTLPSVNVDVLDYDAYQHTVIAASDSVIVPGTLLTSPMFGALTARDVEQVFGEGSSRATVWCTVSPSSRLSSALLSLARNGAKSVAQRVHHYRVVTEGVDGRLTLQAVKRSEGAPDTIAVPAWHGLAGCTARCLPGMEAAVVFLDGDPAKPVVVSYTGLEETATGVATQASQAALMTSLVSLMTTLQAFFNQPSVAAISAGTAQPAAAAAAALATAAVNPLNYSIRTKAS